MLDGQEQDEDQAKDWYHEGSQTALVRRARGTLRSAVQAGVHVSRRDGIGLAADLDRAEKTLVAARPPKPRWYDQKKGHPGAQHATGVHVREADGAVDRSTFSRRRNGTSRKQNAVKAADGRVMPSMLSTRLEMHVRTLPRWRGRPEGPRQGGGFVPRGSQCAVTAKGWLESAGNGKYWSRLKVTRSGGAAGASGGPR